MKALILNSGMGRRMGELTSEHPKCMSSITNEDTILSYQLKRLVTEGIKEVVMTTGLFDQILIDYCHSLELQISYQFVNNPKYDTTNYIYSIECARAFLDDEIIMMHGDLVFSQDVLHGICSSDKSVMAVSSSLPLPDKDFKAVINNGRIKKIGIEFFESAQAAQPLYHLFKIDWMYWLDQIHNYCKNQNMNCYAENAFNSISDQCKLHPYDVKDLLCNEIDTPEDLKMIQERLKK